MAAETPAELWRSAVARDPSRPFVTAYDDTGGRVELSFHTVDNWVSKTANLLVDGLAAEPGERVALALPVHWQSLVWLLACWSTGTTAVPATGADDVPDGDIAVADPARLETALDTDAREVVGASLHPLGAPLPTCPPPAVDYTVEVRAHGDHFTPPTPVDPDSVALHTDSRYSGQALVAAARGRCEAWELTSDDRVAMITRGSDPLTALGADLSRLLCPVLTGSSVMLASGIDSAKLQSQVEMERITGICCAHPDSPTFPGGVRPLN